MRRKQKEKLELNSEKAFERHQSIIRRELERRKLFLENISDLWEMFNTQEYKVILGLDDAQWAGYLGEVAIYYTRSQVERWRKIWQKLEKELEIKPETFIDIPETRLADISNLVSSKEEVEDWFSKARTAIPLDWKNHLAEYRGKPTSEECKHNFQGYEICKICGERHKI